MLFISLSWGLAMHVGAGLEIVGVDGHLLKIERINATVAGNLSSELRFLGAP